VWPTTSAREMLADPFTSTDTADLHDIDVAVAEKPSWANTLKIGESTRNARSPAFVDLHSTPPARTPYTWLPALMYCTTFGFELAVDANLASVLFAAHKNLGQLNAGYYAATFGFMNVWTRPLGGIVGDLVGGRWGPAGESCCSSARELGEG